MLCGNCSLDEGPFPEHPDCKAWKGRLPWYQGTLACPRGDYCRICYYVFTHGGFCIETPKIKVFAVIIEEDEVKRGEFTQARKKYIVMKTENPAITLKGKMDLWPARIVSLETLSKSSISAPKTYLCTLDTYTRKYGTPSEDQIVQRRFNGKLVTGVVVMRDEDEGMYALEDSEQVAVRNEGAMSDLQLKEGQDKETFDALSKKVFAQRDSLKPLKLQPTISLLEGAKKDTKNQSDARRALLGQEENGSESDSNEEASYPEHVMRSSFHSSEIRKSVKPKTPDNGNGNTDLQGQIVPLPPKENQCEGEGVPLPKTGETQTPNAAGEAEAKGQKRKVEEKEPEVLPQKCAKPKAKAGAQPSPQPTSIDTDLILSPDEVSQLPDAKAAEEKAAEAKPKKGGRKSKENMIAEDVAFLWSCQAELQGLLPPPKTLTTREELQKYCEESVESFQALIAKASKKATTTKRRKTTKEDEPDTDLKRVQETAKGFISMFMHMSAEKPVANELKEVFFALKQAGWELPTIFTVKLCEIKIAEYLKFNRYVEVAACFKRSDELGKLMHDVDLALGEPGCVGSQVLSPAVCKLVSLLPRSSTRALLDSVHSANLASFFGAFAGCKADFSLADSTKDDLRTLWLCLSSLSSHEDSASQVPVQEALAAILQVEDVGDKADESSLLFYFKVSEAGGKLLSVLKSNLRKEARKTFDPFLVHKLKLELERARETMASTTTQLQALQTNEECDSCNDLAETWNLLFGKIQGVANEPMLSQDSKKKVMVMELENDWKKGTTQLLNMHITFEFLPFMALLLKDNSAGKPLRSAPAWNVSLIRQLLDDVHCAFLTHDFLHTLRLKAFGSDAAGIADAECSQLQTQWAALEGALEKCILDENSRSRNEILKAFGGAVRSKLGCTVLKKAEDLQYGVRLQILRLMEETEETADEDWAVDKCEQLLCTTTGFPEHEVTKASEMTEFAQTSMSFIRLADATMSAKPVLDNVKEIPNKPDKKTNQVLQSLTFGGH